MVIRGQQDKKEILEGLTNSLDTQQHQWLPVSVLSLDASLLGMSRVSLWPRGSASGRLVGGDLKASRSAWDYFLALSRFVTTSLVTGRATCSLLCPRARVEATQTHMTTVLPQVSWCSMKCSQEAAASVRPCL